MERNRWIEFLRKSDPSGLYEKSLEELEINEIKVNGDTGSWEVVYQREALLSAPEERQLSAAFRDSFGADRVYRFERLNGSTIGAIEASEAPEAPDSPDVADATAIPDSGGVSDYNAVHAITATATAAATVISATATSSATATTATTASATAISTATATGDSIDADDIAGVSDDEEKLFNQRRLQRALEAQGKKKQAPIIGKKISGNPISLSDIREEELNAIIEVAVIKVNRNETMKAGTRLCDFDATDFSSSIKVKLFVNAKRQKTGDWDWLKEGVWLKMRGSVRFDSVRSDSGRVDPSLRELVFFPEDISYSEGNLRRDNAARKRVELHLHTKLSAMDSLIATKDLINLVSDWGCEAVAITDHGVVQAFSDAMVMARAASKGREKPLKIIYGMEGYLIDGDNLNAVKEAAKSKKVSKATSENDEADLTGGASERQIHHVVLLAKNKTGIKNLYKLVTLSHLSYFYRRPLIPRDELAALRDGLIIGSACDAGEIYKLAMTGADQETLFGAASFYDYLEIQPLLNAAHLVRAGLVKDEEGLRDINRRILALGRSLGKPVAATCDAHFLLPQDEALRRILQTGLGYTDAEIQPPLYFRTTEEMLKEFAYLGEEEAYQVVVEATNEIASRIEHLSPIPDKLSAPKVQGAQEEILSIARGRIQELYGEAMPDWIKQRFEREIKSIVDYGYADIFHIARKLVQFSTDNGYLVGSRGSIGSSLVAFLTDITEVNPLPPYYRCPDAVCRRIIAGDPAAYGCGADMPDLACPDCGAGMLKEGFNILFEVFLGFEGEKVPDIDLNFSGELQTKAQKYTEELFGREHVFKAGTVLTVAQKTAYGFVKNYYEAKGEEIRRVELDRLVNGLTGVRRTTSQHPGGIVVLPEGDDISDYTPVQYPANQMDADFVTTHFDYHALESCLIKLDILGHEAPTLIRQLVDMTGKNVFEIPLDERKVLSLFTSPGELGIDTSSGIRTGVIGIPEFGTGFVQSMLLDAKPKTFSDLVMISGFSHGTGVWLGNAQEIIKSGTGVMKDVISSRDDIILTLMRYGVDHRHSFKIMEQVRKGRGLSPDDIAAMRAANVPEWYIDSCLKIQYLFPKAHAAAYVIMSFRIAWFKLYEPLAFYAATFTVSEELDGTVIAGGLYQVEEAMARIRLKMSKREASGREEALYSSFELAREMMLRGFTFLPVHIEKSDATRYLPEGGGLRMPFNALPKLGNVAANNIALARSAKPFQSVEDFRARGKVGSALLAVLREQGAFEGLSESDQQSMF